MILNDWVMGLAALAGFFGWFGVAYSTRLRGSAWVFYPLSMFYAALFFSLLVGNTSASLLHRQLIICAAAAAGLIYVIALQWYWRTHEEPPPMNNPLKPEHALCRSLNCVSKTAWRIIYMNGVTKEICEACMRKEISDEAGLKEIRRLMKY